MASQLNVYGFGVQLQSDINAGNQGGRNYAVISTSADQARFDLAGFIGDDLAKINGPTLIVAGALYANGGTAAPTAPPASTATPYVSGMPAVGGTLNCTMGIWTGEPTSYAYAWMRDGVTVVGTGPSYVPVAADSGHSITCVVTATNALGSTAAPPSNAVTVS